MRKFFLLLLALLLFGTAFSQDDKIVLAESCSFLGKKNFLGPGSYTRLQLGIGDNKLSSFRIPDGMALQVFEQDRFLGRSEVFYSSAACLPPSWNDRVSSVKIFWINNPGNPGGGGESGNNLPPQGSKVIFYRDTKYSGMSRAVNAGSFSSGDLGFLSGQISSIYIPYGLSVNVSDKSGRSYSFTSSQSSLSQYGWDNLIVSGAIQGGGFGGGNTPFPQGDKVIFYGDAKYSGMSKEFNNGSFSPSDLGFLAQNISSVYIPQGKTLKIYDNRGNSRTFTASISDLGQYGWNDKITTGIISGGSSGSLPPQGDKVIFYRDMKYSGTAKEFNYGSVSEGSIKQAGLANNISSLYIPYSSSVQVRDIRGNVQTFTTSISNLAQYGWDNRIYSCTIMKNDGQQGDNGGGSRVVLYTDAGFRGIETQCNPGPVKSLGPAINNNISSIQMPSGYAVTVYDGVNQTGAYRTFTTSVSNLTQYGWNDRISSVYVFRQ